MSDEASMEVALRHCEASAVLPWHALAADEQLMQMEEGAGQGERGWAWLQELVLVFLFGDGDPQCWQNVALRAVALMRYFAPRSLVRRDLKELEGLKREARMVRSFRLDEFEDLAEDEEWQGKLCQLLEYFFPARSKWLKRGCERVYLLAKTYQPELVRMGSRHASYEDLEMLFEGGELRTPQDRGRARAKWSAKAQVLLRHPIERSGAAYAGGKSSTTRAKYAAAARGNQNRKGKKKDL